ncbi:hypothetical protein LSCM1_00927 [Leishmania martiniquensis]|uniref:Uncharacterized protein n=1 Tax=Leishmania martiniquensis TaxID=1580590 RepID=A0A836GXS2_9TRYP|nr:hypothetical protein LSCM1_00927 [Leishmania martiniquensis]
MTPKTTRLVAAAMPVLLLFTLEVQGLNLAFISSGTPSDLLRIAPIVRTAHQRSHSATVLVDSLVLGDCNDVFGGSTCTAVTCSTRGCRDKRADPSRAFSMALRKQYFTSDVILATAFVTEADRISEELGVPLLILSGSASDVLSIHSTSFHLRPPGMGKRLLLQDMVTSAIRGFCASAWDHIGLGALQKPHMIRHIITQGIPGVDITGPVRPNVHPVGFLNSDGDALVRRPFSAVDSFIEGCGGRFVYAAMPAENSAYGQQLYSALRAVVNETNACALWYVLSAQPSSVRFRKSADARRVKITEDNSAAPHYLLLHHHPVAVLTNNVKEILYDAVLAESPIVLIGSNSFSCWQLWSTGIAACASTSRTADIMPALHSVYNNSSVRARLRAARRMGFLMGGAQKAIEVVELVAAVGTGSMDFACDSSILLSPYRHAAAIAIPTTLFLGVLFSLGLRCLQIISKRRGARDAHNRKRLP